MNYYRVIKIISVIACGQRRRERLAIMGRNLGGFGMFCILIKMVISQMYATVVTH